MILLCFLLPAVAEFVAPYIPGADYPASFVDMAFCVRKAETVVLEASDTGVCSLVCASLFYSSGWWCMVGLTYLTWLTS